MTKLWIATELFFPEETSTAFILTKVANKLCNKFDITVFCGKPIYSISQDDLDFKLNSAVKVSHISAGGNDKNSLRSKGSRSLILSVKIFFKLLKNVKRAEKVFMVTNPFLLLILVALAKRIKKFELIILVHDVFPENTIPAGIIKSDRSILYKLLKFFFNWSYAQADLLLVLGRDMKEVIKNKIEPYDTKSNIEVVENWADVTSIFPKSKSEIIEIDSPFLQKIVFQYAGNMGRVQGLLEFLQIIKNCTNDNLLFYFVGDGAVKKKMMEFVDQNNLQNVKFSGAYQRSDQNIILNISDIAVVTLADEMLGLGVPSKLYNLLAAGKPIFYLGDFRSEIAILIREENIGYAFEPSQAEEILQFFNSFDKNYSGDLHIKSKNARDLAVNMYSEDAILNKFVKYIQ